MIVLLHGSRVFGAVESYAVEILQGLRERDVPALLIHADDPALEPFGVVRGGSVDVRTSPSADLFGGSARVFRALRRVLRELEPSVVHLIDVWPIAAVAARAAGVRRLVMTHHTPELPRTDSLAGKVWWHLGWAARPTVIYTSAADMTRDGRRLVPRHVVHYGVDFQRFADAERILPRNGPVVCNVARLEPQKRQDVLIEAFARVRGSHPDARLALVGDGSSRPALESLAQTAGVAEAVIFAGERDDVPRWLASADVFALTSSFEGLCYAVLEAQAAGVPVVATPVGGVRETVVDGVTGITVPIGDVDATATAISRLLDDEPARRALAERASASVHRYSRDAMVEGTLAVYAEDA
jgi:glycosyltransferase involved in cell wall biosynthesis